MNRKGMELSVNILVVIILGIVLLGAGLFLVKKLVDTGEKYNQDIDEELRNQLIREQFSDGRALGVLNPTAQVQRGKDAYFLIGFATDNTEQEFDVSIVYSESSPINEVFMTNSRYADKNAFINHEFRIPDHTVKLQANDQYFFWAVFSPPKDIPPGRYLYDVIVCSEIGTPTNAACSGTTPFFYTGRKLRLIITVV